MSVNIGLRLFCNTGTGSLISAQTEQTEADPNHIPGRNRNFRTPLDVSILNLSQRCTRYRICERKKRWQNLVVSNKTHIFAPVKRQGAIAQLVEQRTENPCVPGSIPGGTTTQNLYNANLSISFWNWEVFLFSRLTPGKSQRKRTEPKSSFDTASVLFSVFQALFFCFFVHEFHPMWKANGWIKGKDNHWKIWVNAKLTFGHCTDWDSALKRLDANYRLDVQENDYICYKNRYI